MKKGVFISIEGGDGAGKGTQIFLLKKWLENKNIPHIFTREPGGCKSAEVLRKLVVEGEDDDWDGLSELFLYSTARHEHLRKTIRPALSAGKWVISDRFADSTTVYQGEARGVKRENVLAIHNLAVGETWPDLTIILDIDPKLGIARSKSNVHASGVLNQETRFENLDISFHEKVREGFLTVAAENPNRCKVVDASQAPEKVHSAIISLLEEFIAKGAVA